jgi:hypothetical protein
MLQEHINEAKRFVDLAPLLTVRSNVFPDYAHDHLGVVWVVTTVSDLV